MIKKQKTLIIVFVSLFAVMLIAYFAVIKPLIAVEDDDTPVVELLPGEVALSAKNSNFYIFEPVQRSSIQSIEVKNEFGGYKIYRDASDTFQLDGCVGLNFNEELFANLVVSSGTPTAMSRVGYDLTDEQLAEYGFDSPQASWTLTDTSGKEYTMYVGDMLLTEGGYYVKYADRNAVYIVGTALSQTILQPVTTLIKPLLTAGMSQNDYFMVDNFTIWHGEELFVHVIRVPDEEKENPNAIVEAKLSYPYAEVDGEKIPYELNETLYFEILYKLMTLKGDSVVAFMPDDATIAEYGLAEPAYIVSYTFNSDYEFYIFISEKQADGSYYATSNLYGFLTICKVSSENIGWVSKDKFDWIFPTPFFENITTVESISIKSENVDVDFRLTHGVDEDGNNSLEVEEINSGVKIPNADVRNFREYYKTLLNITNREYAKLSAEDREALIADDSKLIMTMKYKTIDGATTEYKFYKYYETSTGQISTGKIFVTVNGIGEFYTTNDLINKILADVPRVLQGLDVDAYGKK